MVNRLRQQRNSSRVTRHRAKRIRSPVSSLRSPARSASPRRQAPLSLVSFPPRQRRLRSPVTGHWSPVTARSASRYSLPVNTKSQAHPVAPSLFTPPRAAHPVSGLPSPASVLPHAKACSRLPSLVSRLSSLVSHHSSPVTAPTALRPPARSASPPTFSGHRLLVTDHRGTSRSRMNSETSNVYQMQ